MQREARFGEKDSLEQTAVRLREMGLRAERSLVSKYEKGRRPDLAYLWAFSQIYDSDFGELCAALVREVSNGQLASDAQEPRMPRSVEASNVARAFDEGPELFRGLVRQAMAVRPSLSGSNESLSEPFVAGQHRALGNRGRFRKRR